MPRQRTCRTPASLFPIVGTEPPQGGVPGKRRSRPRGIVPPVRPISLCLTRIEGRFIVGKMDNSRPENNVRTALDAVLESEPVPDEQKPSMGCNIKWKTGNGPDYF